MNFERREAFKQRLNVALRYGELVSRGWMPYPPAASETERQAALDALARGEQVEWYPPCSQESASE